MEVRRVLRELKQVLISEQKKNCTGTGVFGGFIPYIKKLLQILEGEDLSQEEQALSRRLSNLVKHYEYWRPEERYCRLQEVLAVIEDVDTVEVNACSGNPELELMMQDVRYVKGVGPKRREQFYRLGINNVYDLLYYFPRRYEDRTQLKKFSQLTPEQMETVQGEVTSVQTVMPRKGLTIVKAMLFDGEGYGFAVWFNQSYLKNKLQSGLKLIVTGKVRYQYGYKEINVSEFEILGEAQEDSIHTARIVPVYATTAGLSQRLIRQVIHQALQNLPRDFEFLPQTIIDKYKLPALTEALYQAHFPDDWSRLKTAKRRLAYEELFLLQVALADRTRKVKAMNGISHCHEGDLWQQFFAKLPFSLTRAQRRVINEIREDMNSRQPMTRLLQGDVGSGKTVVAAAAAVKAVANGSQVAFMAPTEILAEQHFRSLQAFFAELDISVALLTGSLTAKARAETLSWLSTGKASVVVGTHALIQEDVQFKSLGLVIVDEQHRFGVMQRDKLLAKGKNADLLVMTATPIPRTLSLTLYGDLQLSIIDELPPGRAKVITRWVNEERRPRIYRFLRQEMAAGRQVYVVCPLVAESEKLDLMAAEEMADKLQKIFSEFSVRLLHGQMKPAEKEEIMQGFYRGEIDLLVSTTVIEVGVDVPNATVMLIEGAERFGLAQLHQLRGRIGRGKHRSYCILFGQPKTDVGRQRLRVMEKTTDGFVIAEEDLRLRGPGEFFGTKQHGLPEFKVADLTRDSVLVQRAARDAQHFVASASGQQLSVMRDLIKFRFGEVSVS